MVNWFIFVQHGSHGMLRDFDPLSEAIQRQFNNKFNANNKNDDEESLKQQLQKPKIKIFGTKVNEGTGTDQGTMKCVDNIMPELEKAIGEFCSSENKNPNEPCFFSCVSHSFGGILSREVTKRLHEKGFFHNSNDEEEGLHQQQKSSSPTQIIPLQFVSVASPHCGVNSIEYAFMRWGGWFLGRTYSSTYQELFLDSPLLKQMSTSNSYLRSFTSFQDHLFVGALSHDYLVRFETATLLPFSSVPSQNMTRMRTLENRKTQSTHVLETMNITDSSSSDNNNNDSCNNNYTQLSTCKESVDIAYTLRKALFGMKEEKSAGFRVMPVMIPKEVSVENNNNNNASSFAQWISPQSFCIAHDALMKKGVSWDVLPDVVDSVAEEMVSMLFAAASQEI